MNNQTQTLEQTKTVVTTKNTFKINDVSTDVVDNNTNDDVTDRILQSIVDALKIAVVFLGSSVVVGIVFYIAWTILKAIWLAL